MDKLDKHIVDLETSGYTIIPNVISSESLSEMSKVFDQLIIDYETNFDKNKINENEMGTLRCILSLNQAYNSLVNVKEVTYVAEKLLNKFIHYSFNGFYTSSKFTHPTTYFHRDVPVWTDKVSLSLNCLYFIDDVNADNGATWVVPGSHLLAERPSDEFIEKNKVQVSGKAGSVLIFQSNLFHASGINHTQKPRKCIANVLRRNFMQSQFNWMKVLSSDQLKTFSEYEMSLLGFRNSPQESLEDYYKEGMRRKVEREKNNVKTRYGIEIQ